MKKIYIIVGTALLIAVLLAVGVSQSWALAENGNPLVIIIDSP